MLHTVFASGSAVFRWDCISTSYLVLLSLSQTLVGKVDPEICFPHKPLIECVNMFHFLCHTSLASTYSRTPFFKGIIKKNTLNIEVDCWVLYVFVIKQRVSVPVLLRCNSKCRFSPYEQALHWDPCAQTVSRA